MDNHKPLIYSIVVTYNGMRWVQQCIESLLSSNLPSHIIVIDNQSSDGTPDYIKQNYPIVELIRSDINLGFGQGNNIGLKKSLELNADYIFLLNQDAWVKPETLSILITAYKCTNTFGILSPAHLTKDETALETKFAEYAAPDNCPGLLSDLYFTKTNPVYETKFVNAAAWLISRECLLKTGGFNPIFPHYGEDEDYIIRSRYWGFKIGIVPDARIVHDSIFSWEKIEFNPIRNLIFNLIPLSNINHRYRSAWLLLMKKSADELSTLLLFRKFKKFNLRFSALCKTIILYRKIKLYRELSKQPSAFLN